MMKLSEANSLMFTRYLKILETKPRTTEPTGPAQTSNEHLIWMCLVAIKNEQKYPDDKLSRWLGFIQGIMIMKEYITVIEERNFSRPLFNNLNE